MADRSDFFNAPLADLEVQAAIQAELGLQQHTLELIASEKNSSLGSGLALQHHCSIKGYEPSDSNRV